VAEASRYRADEAAGYGVAPKATLRRLTHSQYNNTVRDLLKDNSSPANQFPPEDFVNGFKNQYAALSLSPILTEAYSRAGEKLAANAFRRGDSHGLIPCRPASENDADCRTRFIETFGRKAFRRPLEPEEIALHQTIFKSEKTFLGGAQAVIEAMLQSPAFLFRLEETSNRKWQPYARASRLSYFVWDTMPDEALLASAAKGELDIAHTEVTDVGLENLVALVNLKEFAAGRGRLTNSGLAAVRMLPTLTRLDLSGARATPPDAPGGRGSGAAIPEETLTAIAGLKELRALYLGYSSISADGLRVLSALEQVERLGLQGCSRVNDAALAELANWKGLKYLDVQETPATEKGLDLLRNAKPALKILSGGVPPAPPAPYNR
jgi:hypothetical protein